MLGLEGSSVATILPIVWDGSVQVCTRHYANHELAVSGRLFERNHVSRLEAQYADRLSLELSSW